MTPVRALSSVVELVCPTIAVVGTFLLVSGHDRPGGGFIAGLVLGAIPLLRHGAGLAPWPRTSLGVPLMGGGVALAAAVAIAGSVSGTPFEQTSWEPVAPVFGDVKLATILAFDVGVTGVVVGAFLVVVGWLDRDPRERRR